MSARQALRRAHGRRTGRARLLALLMSAAMAAGCAAIPNESQPEALPQQRPGRATEAVPEPAPGLDPLTLVREFVEASAEPAADYAAARAYLSERARQQWHPDQNVAVIEDEFSTVYGEAEPDVPRGDSSGDSGRGSDGDAGGGSGGDSGDSEGDSGGSPGDDGGSGPPRGDRPAQTPPAAPPNPASPATDPPTTAPTTPTTSQGPPEQVITVRGGHVGRLGGDGAFIPSDEPVAQSILLRKEDGEWRIVDPPQSIMITASDFEETYFRVPVYFAAPETNVLVPDVRYVVARPQSGLPARVVDLLLSGPSSGLAGAVRNPLGDTASLETNVTTTRDGALSVPLTGVGDRSRQDRELIAAQVVRSLQTVTTSRIRLLSDGSALIDGHADWRPGELPAYEAAATPSSDLPGLMVAGGRIYSLGSGAPIEGPAGAGNYRVQSAAQSLGGDQLAIVEQAGRDVRLRVGLYGEQAQQVDVDAESLTRPTWLPATTRGEQSREVWTVSGGERVLQVVPDGEGRWVAQSVNSAEIAPMGEITELRLSRDGTRAAMIVDGKVVVAAVVRDTESRTSVSLRAPRVLQGDDLSDAVALDWNGQDTLVVATRSESRPVLRVPVDGLRIDQFNSSNLIAPMRGITAAPGRPTVVADATGLWTASDLGDVWRPHDQRSPDAVPFYPG
ncbi:LpqB family beta-propeller domain-containing protein [Prauserella rugosa]|uniref:Sporulation and spore germination protein n=1 Tax=Prauserella rugosa TaxID=43354 RepID=A0A660CA83_9PSEU|nr:sporulation and spore germination protein [Prauserella rugosa]